MKNNLNIKFSIINTYKNKLDSKIGIIEKSLKFFRVFGKVGKL